jgi:hypothetical protein
MALKSGKLSVAKARRIAPVINHSNVDEWVDKARINTHRNLEKLVAANNADLELGVGMGESARYLTEKTVEVRLTMTEAEYLEFKRAQELLCQKMRRPVTLQKTLSHAIGEMIKREDPVLKAQRQLVKAKRGIKSNCELVARSEIGTSRNTYLIRKNETNESREHVMEQKLEPADSKSNQRNESHEINTRMPSVKPGTCQENRANRAAIPRLLLHQIYQRDQGKCQEMLPDGSPCHQSKWIELHHKIPISRGVPHTLENLKTLCSGHHKLEHQKKWLR